MANITTQTIRVDLSTDKVLPTAFTHQNDTARTLVFDMYNGGMPYTMTGNTVKFAYKSPIVNGQYSVIAGASMASGTVSGNKVTVTLPSAYTAISGVGMLTMIITPTSGTVRPVNIRLVVQKSADGDDTIAGASDFPATLGEIAEDWLEENISIQIDDTLSVSGKAADAKVTGDEISELDGQIDDLKSDINSVVYGTNKTFTVERTGYYNVPCVLIDGSTYTYTNNTSAGTNLLLLKSDGTTTVVSTNVAAGASASFVVDGNDYVAIRFYANATGSVSIEGGYSLANARDEIGAATVMHGIELHPGYINASGGISNPSSTSQEVYTDKILCDTGFEFSLSLTYASADTMWVAYALYDESGAFIGRTTLDAGVSRLSYTYTITITNTNARYIAFTFRTHGNCVSVIKSPQYTSIFDIKIGDIDDRLSSVENATQMSATSVRSVNHRGYNTVAPENTLPAYKLSRKIGFDTAETDVAFTSDGVAVLLHDGTINRTARNADGTEISSSIDIGTITYEQALQYDFGIWKGEEYSGTKIPTFEQFIILCKRIGLSAYVELKPTGTTEARVHGLIDTVRNCGMSDCVTWISFYSNLLTFVKNYDSTARIGLVTESVTAETIQTANGLKTDDNEVFIDSDVYSSSVVGTCSSAGIPLEVWTINNQTTMENLDPYITGATSDSLIFGRILYNKYIT